MKIFWLGKKPPICFHTCDNDQLIYCNVKIAQSDRRVQLFRGVVSHMLFNWWASAKSSSKRNIQKSNSVVAISKILDVCVYATRSIFLLQQSERRQVIRTSCLLFSKKERSQEQFRGKSQWRYRPRCYFSPHGCDNYSRYSSRGGGYTSTATWL